VLFTVLHDGNTDFFQKRKGPVDALLHQPHEKVVNRYLTLERDLGARQLVEALLQRVPNALMVHVEVPRGLVDLNRMSDCSLPVKMRIRPKEDKALRDMKEAAVREMKEVYAATLYGLHTLFRNIEPQLHVDMHTMAPWNPEIELVAPNSDDPESFRRYMDAWAKTEKSKYRPLQLFHEVQSAEQGGMKAISTYSRLFAELAKALLTAQGYEADFDKPYKQRDGVHMARTYSTLFGGAPFTLQPDVPKSLLTDDEQEFLAEKPACNPEKVEVLATCFASACEMVLLLQKRLQNTNG
jgi:hypothetical protein